MDIDQLDGPVKAIFQQLFDVQMEAVNDNVRRGELEGWDSLGHIDLLESLNREFKVEIPVDQALEMETVADVKRIVYELRG